MRIVTLTKEQAATMTLLLIIREWKDADARSEKPASEKKK